MRFLYSAGIFLLRLIYGAAAFFNSKAKLFRDGRKDQREALLKIFPLATGEKLVWVHCASLGEFEQGRPVIEGLRSSMPSLKILLTFFSPSGYEVRKSYEGADYIFYLPWDTSRNARWFAENVRPALAVFVKYEFWYHYTVHLHRNQVPLISISAAFRREQVFFKWYGGLFRSLLRSFTHFFVQTQESVTLLDQIGIANVTVSGDTRFDRVNQIVERKVEIPGIDRFKENQKLMVIGSAWDEDIEVLIPFINDNLTKLKFIIAPHEISEGRLATIENSIMGRSIRYSKFTTHPVDDAMVLLIDNVGMLSYLYRYGEFAYVGGGFRQGLHNILEPASYGIPVFFGDRAYKNFPEAVELILRGGGFEVGDYPDLKSKYEFLMSHPDAFLLACDVTRQYVSENSGATEKILAYSAKLLR